MGLLGGLIVRVGIKANAAPEKNSVPRHGECVFCCYCSEIWVDNSKL